MELQLEWLMINRSLSQSPSNQSLLLSLDEIEKVQQLIDESSASLKEDLVRQTLSTEDAKLVLSMPLPYFSVALMLKRNGLIKKKGEEETYFIWKMCLDIAPANEVLYKKKVVHDAICCVCKEEEESAIRTLFGHLEDTQRKGSGGGSSIRGHSDDQLSLFLKLSQICHYSSFKLCNRLHSSISARVSPFRRVCNRCLISVTFIPTSFVLNLPQTKMSIYTLFLERLKRAGPAKDFRQSYVPSKDLKKLLDLPVHKRKAPLLLNFIPTYKSTLPDVPKKKKKSLSPPSATTLPTTSTSQADQGSTSDPADLPSTSTPYLIPIPERKRRRRLVKTAEMGRPKPVAVDLLADLPADVDAVPAQCMPPPKPKRVKKAQPKAKATVVETEDTLPISQLAGSKKTFSAPAKRSAETQPSESTQSKKLRSSSATTSGSRIPKVPWTPEITLEDKPVLASDSADDINVGVALSTTLLFPGYLERNAKISEYENYALMLQHSAIQHAHSFSVQSFKNRERMTEMKKEFSALQKTNKGLQLKMKKLEDQAEAATKAQQIAEEKVESAEAIRNVAEAEKIEAKDRKAQAEKELQEALATKDVEIKEADEKAYAQGMADVTEEYKLQDRQACNRGFSLGWMSLIKKLDLPADSPFRNADGIPLPFPSPLPPNGGEDEDEAEVLVRKSREAVGAKSPSLNEQVLDLTQDEDGDAVAKEATPEQGSSDVPQVNKSIDETLAEIDAEIAADKEAELPGEVAQRDPCPIGQTAKGWILGSGQQLADVSKVQTFGIVHTSLRRLQHPFVCRATNTPGLANASAWVLSSRLTWCSRQL
ncbi:hypothetical protein HYC85_028808 [Camellia sinensis]|uniref:Uncharacterized protein n=1 Tax=Camellia sinensis TaxID=4442 RepID=A0A7J7FWX2_CAMSI|nr:hypothetical protein HYC85_028808 [Camellia sinensis]